MKTQKRMNFSLNEFNDAQRQVVTHPGGPLMVISGAGTGKTHVITGRIRYLITQLSISPERILALTFTEKAAEEMLQRIAAYLPLSHGIPIVKTFHAFCEMVLRERGIEIGIAPDFKLLQDADLLLFLKQNSHQFSFEHYRSLANPIGFLRVFHEYVSRLQDEDITPEAYISYVEKIVKTAKSDQEKEYAFKHHELARAYACYENLLLQGGYLDFAGLIFYTLRLFERRPSVRTHYSEALQHILVDEFQDTNYAQYKIVSLLAKEHSNIIVVGDDDQAIYKWRGASLTNIKSFQAAFPKAKNIVLRDNYRSNQAVLDASYTLIQGNNPYRLEVSEAVDKKLRSVVIRENRPLVLYHFEHVDDEVMFVANQARACLKKGMDTAILVRTNALSAPFLHYLQQAKTPVEHNMPSSLLSKEAVKDCIALIRVLVDPTDDLALFRFLSIPLWKIPMTQLLALLKQARHTTRPLYHSMCEEPFTGCKKKLDTLIEYSRIERVGLVIGKFFELSDYMDFLPEEHVENIASFSELVSEFENTHPHHNKVIDFYYYLTLLEETGESRNVQNALDPKSIKILTIHGAKGLEFDAVFIPGLVQGKFPVMRRKESLEIPQELIPEVLPDGDQHSAEERRLLYVACTRAKQLCHLSFSDFYTGKKRWKQSQFIQELLDHGAITLAGAATKKRSKKQEPLPLTTCISTDRLHRTLNLTALSYTQMDTFRTCPLKYQFRYLFAIPTPQPAAVTFGSSIHNTLRDFYTALQKEPHAIQREEMLSLLLEFFEKNWIPYGYASKADQEYQKTYGKRMLKKYYAREKKRLIIPIYIERSFTFVLNNLKVTGRIDRIDQVADGTYEVIDYKTGSNKQKNLDRDLQLSLYALACKDVFKLPVSKLSLYYLEGLEKVSTTRSDEQLKACRREIEDMAKKMNSSDFSPTPGYHCSYCEYRLICPAAMVINKV